jgi:hypothetical protein
MNAINFTVMKTILLNKKKRLSILCLIVVLFIRTAYSQPIIIDHTCTDISKIPDEWIQKVKNDQMLFSVAGESHGRAYMYGLQLLAAQDTTFAVSSSWWGNQPAAIATPCLRAWYRSGGEANFWTNHIAVTNNLVFL